MKNFFTHPVSIKILTLAICIVGIYLRVPDRFFVPQFWAEDGPILFIQAASGGISSLFEPYQGALYTFQRFAALCVVQLPWEYAPAGFMVFAWLAFVSVVLWCLSDRIPAPLPARIVMAMAIAYAPVKNETYLNLVNAHWTLSGLGLILLLMSAEPKNRSQRIFDYFMSVLLSLTGPFCLIYLPLFAVRAYRTPGKHSKVILLLVIACSLIQIVQLDSRDYQLMGGVLNPSVAQFLSVFTFRFLWTIVGYETVAFHTLSMPVALPAALTIVALFLFVARQAYNAGGYPWTAPLFASALVLGATFVQYREMPEALINAARYFFVPIVAFIWGVTLAAAVRPYLFAPLLAANLIVFLLHPSWLEYDMPDLKWRESSHCLRDDPNCIIPIHPTGFEFNVFSPPKGELMKADAIFARMRANADAIKKRRE